ncbi:MAG: DegT/DnrJ/EryC1/StrS family aminotransferase [Arenibacter sp.]
MINVTKAFFPPLAEYIHHLERIWKNEWLTNRGELVLELENKLKEHLEVPNLLLLNNGTIPLQIALKLLGNQGEIITTPFSYIATSSSIIWENCIPVFVDIHSKYLTIDESKIEAALTSRTTAILATHVFGNPCDVEAIEKIAKKNNLKVIYDSAHAFGVTYKGKSLFTYGDINTCSFHATKLFHTGEGGAIFCKDDQLMHKAFYSHNFGHNGPTEFHGLGINGKMSELQAAMGLSVLPYIESVLKARKKIVDYYIQNLDSKKFKFIKIREGTEWNYSYCPIVLESEVLLLRVLDKLKAHEIFPRRYFYPSLNTIDYISGASMPISENISARILCLPLYHNLESSSYELIVNLLNKC